jgi:predicted nucleic acid-binding protein
VSYLLDTNAISEWVKPRPDPLLMEWMASTDEDQVFLSVVSVAEIRRGIELMSPGIRRDRLTTWLTIELPVRFERRVLSIDQPVADAWGLITAGAQRNGTGLDTMDAFLAATASVHRLTLVTRNTLDFARLGIELLNPWQPHR